MTLWQSTSHFFIYEISSRYTCEYANAIVIATPLPQYELDSCGMTAYPTYLDANDYDGTHQSFVRALLYNGSGNPFTIDMGYTSPLWMKFTIENPLNGMRIRGWSADGTSIIGDTSIVVPLSNFSATGSGSTGGANSNIYFEWDGGNISKEIDTVSVRAEAYGVSGTQKIELRKIIPHHFTVTPDVNPIYAGESVNVRAIAKNRNDEEVALDGGKSITFSDESGTGSFIVGSDTIPSKAIVTYDQAKSGSIKYYSKLDTSNLVDRGVWIDAALTEHPERNGYGYLEVTPGCPVVSLSKSKISPGNTTAVSVMAQTVQGVFPYPSGQNFIASMDADARYGKLRCESDSGTSILGTQPFEFIAADSIDVDSIVVKITVSPVSYGGGATSIHDGRNDSLQRQAALMSEKQTKALVEKVVSIKDGINKDNIIPQASMTKKLSVKENIVAEKIAKKQILMNTITEAIKTRKAGKGNITSAKQLNAMVQDLAEGASCNRSADVTIEGPKLVVDSLKGDDYTQKITGTNPPTMPKPMIKVQLENYHNDKDGTVNFHYALKIHWKDAVETPHDKNEQYTGDTTGTNDQKINWTLNLDKYNMRGGNDITLIVTATTADGKVYKTNPDTLKNPFVIKGKNPVVATVLAEFKNHLYTSYTVDNYAAVAWDESRFNQFSNASKANSNYFITYPHSPTLDYPLMGGTGVGLMQIDPPPNDTVVWNWVENVKKGQDHFKQDIDYAKNYQNTEYFNDCSTTPDSLKNVPTSTDIMQNQVFLQAYCYYNSGFTKQPRYWDWVEQVIKENGQTFPGHWEKNTKTWQKTETNPKTGPVDHANAVWSYFISNPKPWNE